jgi:uncharacterized membrane protein YhhN
MMQKREGYLTLLFLFFAGFYLAFIHALPYTGDFVIKAIPALTLAYMAFTMIPGATGKILGVGFILSAGGDIALSFPGDQQFMMGLGLFLLAHLTYIVVFLLKRRTRYTTRIPLMAAILFFAGAMAVVLAPHLGPLQIPVFVYISVIAVMGVTSALREGVSPVLMLGAMTFMLSDSLIAVNKFLLPVPGSKYAIMVTYYLGQYLICRAFLIPQQNQQA